MVAGSIVNQLKAIIATPSSLLNTLGLAVPQTATFFITYVLTAGNSILHSVGHLKPYVLS